MNSNGGWGGELHSFSLCQSHSPWQGKLQTWNTEMQRQTVFGMSSDRHFEPKAFILKESIQKEEDKGPLSTLSHNRAQVCTF